MQNNNRKSYNEKHIPLIALLIAFVMLVSFLVALLKFPRVNNADVEGVSSYSSAHIDDSVAEEQESDVSEPQATKPQKDKENQYYKNIDFTTVSVNNAEVSNGSLAVIKPDNKYFPVVDEENLTNIYAKKTPKKYDLSTVALDVYDEAFQCFDDLFVKFYDSVSGSKVIVNKAYLNKNECSGDAQSLDLSTGYSVQLQSVSDDKAIFLREQSYKYGIIQRYPSGKDLFTGYEGNSSLYRYVGHAHSYYMNYYKFCLEEYIDKLRTESIIEFKSGIENAIYVVYYVPMDGNASSTNVKVPADENYQYSISGDGAEGFIVTVKVSQ